MASIEELMKKKGMENSIPSLAETKTKKRRRRSRIYETQVEKELNPSETSPETSLSGNEQRVTAKISDTPLPLRESARKSKFSNKNQNTPGVQIRSKVETTPNVQNKSKIQTTPHVKNTPQIQNKPNVEIRSKVTLEPNTQNISNTQFEPKVINEPQVQITPKPILQASETPIQKVGKGTVKQTASIRALERFSHQLDEGHTGIPNEVLLRIIRGELKKTEAQVFLAIVRLTRGFNKDQAPISLSVLTTLTGLQSSKVSHALNALVKFGLINRMSGDISTPNQITLRYNKERSKIGTRAPRVENEPQVQKTPHVGNTPEVDTKPQALGANETQGVRSKSDLHYIQDIKNIHSLSEPKKTFPSIIPEKILQYLSELKGAERVGELRLFKRLRLQEDREGDLDSLFDWVRKNGEVGSGKEVYKSFAYLNQWYSSVRKEVRKSSQSSVDTEKREAAQKASEAKDREEDLKNDQEWSRAEAAFFKAFESEEQQERKIDEIADTLPFGANGPGRRALAISRWYSAQK